MGDEAELYARRDRPATVPPLRRLWEQKQWVNCIGMDNACLCDSRYRGAGGCEGPALENPAVAPSGPRS
jgi:hypothetical protein